MKLEADVKNARTPKTIYGVHYLNRFKDLKWTTAT